MELKPFGSVIKAAVVAGVLAAMLVALFHFALTEPVIERAIALEEALGEAAGKAGEAPVVSRDGQRAGLFLGFLLYGLTWALLLSATYHIIQSRLRSRDTLRQAILAALLTGWSVALFPFLKYPANPPGVGDPETIQQRQALYVIFIVLSVASTLLALAAHRYFGGQRWAGSSRWRQRALAGTLYVVVAAVLFVAMPANLDAVTMPADLVTAFRVLSFAGLALFWVVFAGSFAWLTRTSVEVRGAAR